MVDSLTLYLQTYHLHGAFSLKMVEGDAMELSELALQYRSLIF